MQNIVILYELKVVEIYECTKEIRFIQVPRGANVRIAVLLTRLRPHTAEEINYNNY